MKIKKLKKEFMLRETSEKVNEVIDVVNSLPDTNIECIYCGKPNDSEFEIWCSEEGKEYHFSCSPKLIKVGEKAEPKCECECHKEGWSGKKHHGYYQDKCSCRWNSKEGEIDYDLDCSEHGEPKPQDWEKGLDKIHNILDGYGTDEKWYKGSEIKQFISEEREKVREEDCDIKPDWTGKPEVDRLWHEGYHYGKTKAKQSLREELVREIEKERQTFEWEQAERSGLLAKKEKEGYPIPESLNQALEHLINRVNKKVHFNEGLDKVLEIIKKG